MNNVTTTQLVADLGFTRDDVAQLWGKVYLQGFAETGRDYHSEFADALGCTRDQAKQISYWFQYTTPYLQSLSRLSREGIAYLVRTTVVRNRDNGNTNFDMISYLDGLEARYEQERAALSIGQRPGSIQS